MPELPDNFDEIIRRAVNAAEKSQPVPLGIIMSYVPSLGTPVTASRDEAGTAVWRTLTRQIRRSDQMGSTASIATVPGVTPTFASIQDAAEQYLVLRNKQTEREFFNESLGEPYEPRTVAPEWSMSDMSREAIEASICTFAERYSRPTSIPHTGITLTPPVPSEPQSPPSAFTPPPEPSYDPPQSRKEYPRLLDL